MRSALGGLGARVAVAGWVIWIASCGGGQPNEGDAERPPTADGRWLGVPRPPGAENGYQSLSAHSVGDRVVVVAEVDYDQAQVKALTFDPSRRRWAAARESGAWWRYGPATVATDDGVIVHGGCCGPGGRGSRATALAYEVGGDRWDDLPDGPLGNRFGHAGVWTGREAIFWGGSGESRGRRDQPGALTASGAAYDPVARDWRPLARSPLPARSGHAAVWTGAEMLVWGGARPAGDGTHRFLRDGAAYDPRADAWRRIPDAPIRSQLGPDPEPDATEAIWTGAEMIVWNGRQGASYDLEADRWDRLPPVPQGSRGSMGTDTAIWTGEEMIVWGGVRGADRFVDSGAAYDPDAGAWRRLPDSPLRGRDRHAAAWTGEAMLVWGGCCRGTRYMGDGALYVPAG